MNALKAVGAILLSMVLGGLIGRYIGLLTLPPYTGGDALHSPNLDKFLLLAISSFFGVAKGLSFSALTLVLVKGGILPNLKVWQIIVLVAVFGLINSLIFAFLEYNNAIYGLLPPFILEADAKATILKTGITELITGCIISSVSVILVKFLCTSSTTGNEPLK
ncbi:MAG: hypothetical protein ABI878_01165 [Acidobacteriota bacterium]